jgi:hypothetical protein
MAAFCLDRQVFYTGPVPAAPTLKSHSVLPRNGNGDPSAAICGATVRRAFPHAAPLQDARKLLVASYIASAYPVIANEDRPGAGEKPLTQALIGKCDVKQTSYPFLSGSFGFAHHARLL